MLRLQRHGYIAGCLLLLLVLTGCELSSAPDRPVAMEPQLTLSGALTTGLIESGTLNMAGSGIEDTTLDLGNETLEEGRLETQLSGSGHIDLGIQLFPVTSADYSGIATSYVDTARPELVSGDTTEVTLRPQPDRAQFFANRGADGVVRARDLSGEQVELSAEDFWPDEVLVDFDIDPIKSAQLLPNIQIVPLESGAFYALGLTDQPGEDVGFVTFQPEIGVGRFIDTSETTGISPPFEITLNTRTASLYSIDAIAQGIDVYNIETVNDPVSVPDVETVVVEDVPDYEYASLSVNQDNGDVLLFQRDGAPENPDFAISRFSAGDFEAGGAEPEESREIDTAFLDARFDMDLSEIDVFSFGTIAWHPELGIMAPAYVVDENAEQYESALLLFDDESLEYEGSIQIRRVTDAGEDEIPKLPVSFESIGENTALMRLFLDDDPDIVSFATVDLTTADILDAARGSDFGVVLDGE